MPPPRFVLCVLGTWTSWDDLERIVPEGWMLDRDYAQLTPDPRMPRAFTASADRVMPSFTDADTAAIEQHTAVAYLISPAIHHTTARATSREALALIAAALGAGGTAAKCESSGIAHGATRWRELAAALGSEDPLEVAWALKDAFVRRPIGDSPLLYSCGMHLLGERDVEITRSDDIADDLRWLDLFLVFLLSEQPATGMQPGEKFGIETGGARRALDHHACTRFGDEDFMFNPFGYWRLA